MATETLTTSTATGISSSSKTYKNFIDGEWVESRSGYMFEDRNPADTRDVVGVFQKSNREDVDSAVDAAKRAFKKWRLVPAPRRAEIVYRASEILIERKLRITAFMECRVHHPEVYWTKLALAGVEAIQVGIEALSPTLIRSMNKGTRAKQNLLVQKWLKELGIESPFDEKWFERPSQDHRITTQIHIGDHDEARRAGDVVGSAPTEKSLVLDDPEELHVLVSVVRLMC